MFGKILKCVLHSLICALSGTHYVLVISNISMMIAKGFTRPMSRMYVSDRELRSLSQHTEVANDQFRGTVCDSDVAVSD